MAQVLVERERRRLKDLEQQQQLSLPNQLPLPKQKQVVRKLKRLKQDASERTCSSLKSRKLNLIQTNEVNVSPSSNNLIDNNNNNNNNVDDDNKQVFPSSIQGSTILSIPSCIANLLFYNLFFDLTLNTSFRPSEVESSSLLGRLQTALIRQQILTNLCSFMMSTPSANNAETIHSKFVEIATAQGIVFLP